MIGNFASWTQGIVIACRYLDTNVALETHISFLTDTGKTMFVSQCFSQILGEACLLLANTTIN